jgi:hypothetical protein
MFVLHGAHPTFFSAEPFMAGKGKQIDKNTTKIVDK